MSNGNKNTIFVETNVMNISAEFQLHPPLMASEEMIFEFFRKFSFWLPWTKFICLVEDYSRNISVKLLSKYLQ